MTGPTRTRPAAGPDADPRDRRIRQTWWLLAGSFAIPGLIVVVRLGGPDARTIDFVLAGLVVIVAGAAILHRNAVRGLEVGRRAEAETFARILQGLSRSVSPESIVGAIVEDLGQVTGADHIVVVRRRPEANALEATLVSSRPGVASSTTLIPASELDDPIDDGMIPRELVAVGGAARVTASRPFRFARPDGAPHRIADRIADRVGRIYGLSHTIAAPLRSQDEVIGAIVLSRRTGGSWPAASQRILAGAAFEASAALTRALSHQAAEERASTDALTGCPTAATSTSSAGCSRVAGGPTTASGF